MYKYANNFDEETLRKRLAEEPFERTTLSFYRYVKLQNPQHLRNELYAEWEQLGVLGRVYLAQEGINAQVSIPRPQLEAFKNALHARPEFHGIPFKFAVEEGNAFIKLKMKVKKQIVADGLAPDQYDLSNVGRHLTPEEWNVLMDDPDTIVVDMRNHYESRVGHFEKAVTPDVDTFRDELPKVKALLNGNEGKKILLYCTGGVRCEKASAYLKHHGFKDVNQLYGGIINYGHAVKAGKIESKYKGKNFVFDERLLETITDDVLTTCDQCDTPSDRLINCANEACHLLFVQCEGCGEKMDHCCTAECQEIALLPLEKQRALRKGNAHPTAKPVYADRLRPRLKKPATA